MPRYHEDNYIPTGDPKLVWVFGSNMAGIHGAGAALVALNNFGARPGRGYGFSGSSYGIATKDTKLKPLPLSDIALNVEAFKNWVRIMAQGRLFFVTRIGCGLAGYQDSQIAPMFRGAPDCCSFAEAWREWL